jgi:hypothetical protein
MSDKQLERLKRIMEIQSMDDHAWWDSEGILKENKPKEQVRKDRLEDLKNQGLMQSKRDIKN